MTHKQYFNKCMKDPEFKREYESLDLKYSLKRRLIEIQVRGEATLKSIAAKAQLSQASIVRFAKGELSDDLSFLSKLATAMGMKLKVDFA